MNADYQVCGSAGELGRTAAAHFVARSREATAARGSFSVALSGGSTPKLLYQLLADPGEPFRDQIEWSKIHFFWSDERHVPPDHPDSNFRMANEALLSRVPVPPQNIYRVYSENSNAGDAAREYEQTLRAVTHENQPRLDLIFLGLGSDGHTASIFPGSEVLNETEHLVAAPWVEKLNAYRITMTLPLLNNGVSVVFLVSGAEKAEIVKEVLHGEYKYPAQAVRAASGNLLWMLDRDAAGQL